MKNEETRVLGTRKKGMNRPEGLGLKVGMSRGWETEKRMNMNLYGTRMRLQPL